MRVFPIFSFLSLLLGKFRSDRAVIERWLTTFLFWTIARLRAVKNFLLLALRSEGNRSMKECVGEETYEPDGSYLLAVAQADAYLVHHDEMKN